MEPHGNPAPREKGNPMRRWKKTAGLSAGRAGFLAVLILSACGGESPMPSGSGFDASHRAEQENPGPTAPFTGRIVFQSNMDGDNDLYLLTQGGLKALTDNDGQDEYPVWSPDGRRVAFTSDRDGRYHIYIMNADGTGIERVTAADADDKEPAWWPDGGSLVFTREKKRLVGSRISLHRVNLADGRVRRLIPDLSKSHGIAHVSPSADLVTFTVKRTFGWDAAVFETESRKVRFLDEGGKSCRGRFSPDGLRLAYVSSRADGKGDIWIVDRNGSDRRRLTLRDDTHDYFPAWSPDGRFVVFDSSIQHDHEGDWSLMLVEVATGNVAPLFDSPGNDVFPDWK